MHLMCSYVRWKGDTDEENVVMILNIETSLVNSAVKKRFKCNIFLKRILPTSIKFILTHS